jgi:hypothetical protein
MPTENMPSKNIAGINPEMKAEDQLKLMQLIATSKSNTTESWESYEFTSQKLYVNAQGQPCRDYLLKSSGVFTDESVSQTACRDTKGVWQIK